MKRFRYFCISRNFLTVASLMRTHYDVLNLGKNCSAKEIKNSFLKLSKIYHPDRNKQADAHLKFVEVNEAYSVLGKPESRLRYDESLYAQSRTEHRSYGVPPHMKTYEHYAKMYARERSSDVGATYFSRSKLQLFSFCFVLILIGTAIQLKALSNRRYISSHQIAVSLKGAGGRHTKTHEEVIEKLKKASKKV